MKVQITYEINDDQRKALAKHLGEKGKATRQLVRDWILMTLDTTLEGIEEDE